MSDGTSSGQAAAASGEATGEANAATAQTQTSESQVAETTEEASDETEHKEEATKELHKLQKKLQEKHKDRKFEKDSDYFDVLDEELLGHEKYYEENTKSNEKIIDLFESNPELGDILRDMDKGATFIEALARNVDLDSITPFEDDPDYDGWEKAKTERMSKLKERKDFQKKYDENLKVSVKVFQDYGKERGWDAAKAKDFTGKIDAVMGELSNGVISKAFLDMMHKGLNYDQDIKDAEETAVIKGRNETIEVKRNETEKTGDGLPKVAATGESEVDAPKEEQVMDVFSKAVLNANKRQEAAYGKRK